MLTKILLLSVYVLGTVSDDNAACKVRNLDNPIAQRDGDFIIGGMFQIGQLQYKNHENGTEIPVEHCSYESAREYNIQKAIVLRMLVDKENKRFLRDFNKTLGYEIYDTCMSSAVTTRASFKLASNRKVVGVTSVDYKSFIQRSASVTASFHIPTVVYMFNDDELMTASKYPTLLSMIDTEIKEAEITIRFLEKMGYQYMDIWYHKFSKDMAEHIYNSYVKKVGCGRIADITSKSDISKMNQTYTESGGTSSQVQLILHNSGTTTRAILQYMVDNLGFQNKIYILGLSNGRLTYLNGYTEILQSSERYTLISPLPDLLNTKLKETPKYLNKDWRQVEKVDYMDKIYEKIQSNRCPKDMDEPKECRLTSWLPYMIGGVQLILESLYTGLTKKIKPTSDCFMDFKTELFKEIVRENRTLLVNLEDELTISLKMFKKTVNTGYKIGVFRSEHQTLETLGRAFFDRIVVTDKHLLDSISGYNKTCSPTCLPGTYRLFKDSLKYLPCCWTCEPCKLNQYSTENDSNLCNSCETEMSSTENRTACITIPEKYVGPNSTIFIAGASCIPVGVIMVIIFGVLIFRNEDRPVIKASDPGYLYMVLLSLLVGYLTAFLPLVKPSNTACSIEYYAFVYFATLISINLLLKCIKVYDIFAASKKFTTPKAALLIKKLGQTTFSVISLVITTVILLIDRFTGVGPSWAFMKYQQLPHTSRYLMCSSVEDKILVIPMVIPGVAFVLTLILAFKMRKFPHNFRESLNIFCATFMVLLCSIMFLAGYTFSSPQIRPILRCIVILVTSTAFLVCIYVPKIVILLDKEVDIERERASIRRRVTTFSGKGT